MSTWYLGPLGDLRPLVCPEPNIRMSVVRYGGVHQGLSGARTMDVTGHRQDFEFVFEYLEEDEYAWLEALHTRLVPGPHKLINPMRRNRLSLRSSNCLVAQGRQRDGLQIPSRVTVERVPDFPAGYLGRSVRLSDWDEDYGYFRLDRYKPVPIMPGETLTVSMHLKTETSGAVGQIHTEWYNADGELFTTTSHGEYALSESWDRHVRANIQPPQGAVGVVASFVLNNTPVIPVYVAMPQVEVGSSATDWQIGGGAVEVLVDQLETDSPRFPVYNTTLTLLEA